MRGGVGVRELHEVIRALLFLEHAREREAVILGLEERVDGGDGKVSGRGTECVARVARGTNDGGGGGRIVAHRRGGGALAGDGGDVGNVRAVAAVGRFRDVVGREALGGEVRARGRVVARGTRNGSGVDRRGRTPGRAPEGVSELARAGRRGRVRGVETPASRK